MLNIMASICKIRTKRKICINGVVQLYDSPGCVVRVATEVQQSGVAEDDIGATSDKDICVSSIIFGTIAC